MAPPSTATLARAEIGERPRTERDSGRWLAAELERHAGRTAPESLVRLSVPAPERPPEALLEIAEGALAAGDRRGERAFLWHPPTGAAVAGVGFAARIELAGRGRFGDLRRDAEEIFTRLDTSAHPSCPAPPARLYGGLAFDVGAAAAEPWEEFGDGAFTLPRLAYASGARPASLTLTVSGREIAQSADRDLLASELESWLEALERWRPQLRPAPGLVSVRRPDRGRFAARVEAIRDAIAGGEFSKIVAAGASQARLERPLRASAVLGRLSRGVVDGSGTVRFAFLRPRSAFLGATPERLVALRGAALETEALAGSIESGGEHGAELLRSAKDLREHQLVVDDIARRLAPLCAELRVAEPPQIRELRDVLHLHTPISGILAAPRHVLELVEELHPTPAVGGVPTERAMRWISRHEREPRGWYAAPVGWFDARGDGEFAVALRSCVLRGATAHIYAGAGIVRDSDPDLEYVETELKKQALLTALGG